MQAMKASVVVLCACSIGTAYAYARQPVEPAAPGHVGCVPYDPAALKLTEHTNGTWLLMRADGARFRVFANRPDAEAGLAVFKEHSSLCYIGRGNSLPNSERYVMEFLK